MSTVNVFEALQNLWVREHYIIRFLASVGLADEKQISRLFFSDVSASSRRRSLKRLVDRGVLRRVVWSFPYKSSARFNEVTALYTLGEAGARFMWEDASWRDVERQHNPFFFEQNLIAAEMFTRATEHYNGLCIGADKQAGNVKVGFERPEYEVEWLREADVVISQDGRAIARPDGFFRVSREAGKPDDFFLEGFVEIDRGKTNWRKKVKTYGRVFGDEELGKPPLWEPRPPVGCVFVIYTRRKYIKDLPGLMDKTGMTGRGIVFLCKSLAELETTPFNEGWAQWGVRERAVNLERGYRPLND